MNCTQAKEISIVSFLTRQGHDPVRNSHNEYWYLSPFRNENTASFKVFADEKHWIDYGTGHGGDIIKLAVLLFNTNESQALQILSNQASTIPFSFTQAINQADTSKEQRIKIDSLKPIQNTALIEYAKSRKIHSSTLRKYTQEAYYTIRDKRYFSIAFKNDSGGYELRNKLFKNCLSPKQITTFQIPGSKRLNLFEGFFDFLSALEYYQRDKPASTTIVLNSLVNLPAVLSTLSDFETIHLYLDNDSPGVEAYKQILAIRPDTVNKSQILFPTFKDFNEFLISTI